MFLVSPGTYVSDFYFLFAMARLFLPVPHGAKIDHLTCNCVVHLHLHLPISFLGIVGVYVPSLVELVIVVWPPIHDSHAHTHTHTYKHLIVLLSVRY